MTMPAVGALAPDFTLDTDAGTPLTLSALRGRAVVLYFYPKDDTPGCTTESCEFRDLQPRFEGVNAQVLGISADSVESHVKFRKKYKLNFPLLADVDHVVAEQYGTWQHKSLFGHKFWGVVRTTFIIDPSGRVARVFKKVKAAGHAAEVAEAVKALG
jgi:thioredoxin-dependent peroxiredoxin